MRISTFLLVLITFLLPLATTTAAAPPPAGLMTSLSYTPVYQLPAEIDGSGDYSVQRHYLHLGLFKPLSRNTRAGLSLKFAFEDWDFDLPGAIAGTSWQRVIYPGISLNLIHSFTPNWHLLLAPSLGLAMVPEAEIKDSLVLGGVAGISHQWSPDLQLGLGFGLLDGLERWQIFPFISVDWRIHKAWRLKNPLAAGPFGPAGLELEFQPNRLWSLSCGGVYRSYRFRLAQDNRVAGGIGKIDLTAAFLKTVYRPRPWLSLDLSLGALFDGRLGAESSGGATLEQRRFSTAPLLAFGVNARF